MNQKKKPNKITLEIKSQNGTPYPWYIKPLSMVFQTPYPRYLEPLTRAIFNPLSIVYQPTYSRYIEPMVFDPATHGILTP